MTTNQILVMTFEEGCTAYRNNISIAQNPYDPDIERECYQQWESGWKFEDNRFYNSLK